MLSLVNHLHADHYYQASGKFRLYIEFQDLNHVLQGPVSLTGTLSEVQEPKRMDSRCRSQ